MWDGEEIDGIDYVSDDLQELRIYRALEMYWTPLGDAVADAGAEQIAAAMAEAERHDCRRTDEYFALKWVPDVREKLRHVMAQHRVTIPEADYGDLQQFVEIPSGYGTPLLFDKNDSAQWRGLFGLVAGNEREVHVLRGDYTPERWIAEVKRTRRDCQWNGPDCAEYAHCLLTFSSGAFIVGVPTCFGCEAWLLAGGSRNTPLTHLGV